MIIILFFNTEPCFAGMMSDTDVSTSFNGFYAGASLGVSNLLDKEQQIVNTETHQLGSLGIIGGGFVGYNYYLSEHVSIDIEGFGNATGLNAAITHSTNGATTYQSNTHYNAGVRMLPGYQCSPRLQGHVLIGYANANFQIQDNGTYGYINTSTNKSGFQAGLGWTTPLTSYFLARLDMLWTTYGSITSVGAGLTTAAQTYTNNYATFEGELSLIYKF
jgi:hypothetical protein